MGTVLSLGSGGFCIFLKHTVITMRLKGNRSGFWAAMAALLLAGILLGCKTEGFDGDGSISGKVVRNGIKISGATVYVKFHAKESPGSRESDFDASVSTYASGNYTVAQLKRGDYYLFAIGYDSSINTVVSGGLAVTIAKGQLLEADINVRE